MQYGKVAPLQEKIDKKHLFDHVGIHFSMIHMLFMNV